MESDKKSSATDDFVFDKRLYVIFLIMFTEVLGFSMLFPVIPYLGLSLGLTESQIGLILSLFSLCQLFASPITGKLSDHFGRKPLLILSQISTLMGFILLGFATTVIILIVARLIDGLLGSNMTVSQAYISDITEPKHRTRVYSYSSGVFGAGLIFGPIIGGVLAQINYSVPMFFAASVTIVSIILVVFLPETINKKTKAISFNFNDVIPVNDIKRFQKVQKIRNSLLMFFVYNTGFFLFMANFPLFASTQFQVTVTETSYFMTWIGILRVIIQTVLISRILRDLGENKALVTGIVSMIISMIIIIFSADFFIVFIPLVFLAYGTGVCRPILISQLTNSETTEGTGALLGVNNSLTSVAQIVTPIVGGFVIEYLPSQILPLLSAVIFILLVVFLRRRSNNEDGLSIEKKIRISKNN